MSTKTVLEKSPIKSLKIVESKKEKNCIIDIVGNNLWILTKKQPGNQNDILIKELKKSLSIEWHANKNDLIIELLCNFNLLKNGTFGNPSEKSLSGWETDVIGPAIAGVDLSEELRLKDGHTAFLSSNSNAERPSFIAKHKIPVVGDGIKEYFFSGFFATHRAGGSININFYDKSDNKIGEKIVAVPLDHKYLGGQSLTSYAHIKSIFVPVKDTQYVRFKIKLGEQEDFHEPNAFLFFTGLYLAAHDETKANRFLPYSSSIDRLNKIIFEDKWLGFGSIRLPILDEIDLISLEYLNHNHAVDLKSELEIIKIIERQQKRQDASLSARETDCQFGTEQIYIKDRVNLLEQINQLEQIKLVSEMFDEEHYYSQLGFIKENGLMHFLKEGYLMDLNPNIYFDSIWYQKEFNINKNEINPFIHFCLYGCKEGKNPSKNFEVDFYLSEYPDIDINVLNPLLHYMLYGRKEGRFKTIQEKKQNDLRVILNNFENNINEDLIDLTKFHLQKQDEQFLEYLLENKRGSLDTIVIDDTCELISLDIWDTVLRRKTHPDEIKLSAARYIFINYYWKLKPGYRSIDALYKSRRIAEDKSSLTEDYEYKYEDAIALWLPTVFENGTRKALLLKIRDALLDHELCAEKRASQIDSGMQKFLRQQNLSQIVFTSDFYMPARFIKCLLKKHGLLDTFTKGYVSCDWIKNKRSGQLFDHILEEFRLKPSQVIHIGDNKHADVIIPSKKGFNTFHYNDAHENKLHNWFLEAFNAHLEGDSSIHERRILSILEQKARNLKDSKNKTLKQIGIRFAPVAIGLILKIIEEAKRLEAASVYFFTREGVFLKELYDLIVNADPYYSNYPKSELLEVSRVSTFAPSLEKVDVDNLMRLWNQYSEQSPKAFCKTLNIDTKELQKLFESFSLPYNEIVTYPWKNIHFIKLLNSLEFRSIVKRTIDVQKTNLKNYLKEKGLNCENSANLVVDLGWRGTIQDNISFVVDGHLHGVYLGLFRYLNEQPTGVSKTGWLFDKNLQNETWYGEEVGPIEMLFNSLGGSTISYEITDNQIIAVKKEESAEDSVFKKYTSHLQEGIKLAVTDVVDYVSIHALTSDNIRTVSRQIVKSLIKNPPAEFANAFFNLTHNETFGTGEYQSMVKSSTLATNIQGLNGSALHFEVQNFLAKTRWKEGFLCLESTQKIVKDFKGDITHTPLEFYQNTVLKGKNNTFKVGIYAPPPIVGSGGHRTLFNLARKFVEAGCEVYCFLEEEGSGIDSVRHYLKGAETIVHVGWPTYLELDMAVATIAHSAQIVAKMPNVKHKAYLVQDFEAWFNPVGDFYTIAENSYSYGLTHFTVGNFLTHVIKTQYTGKAIPAGLGIDTRMYFDKEKKREKAICFLYQPEKHRRNPLLAINALRIVKQIIPEVKIYVYGSDAPINLDFEVENLGLVRDLNELNDLYNKCEVGLCISMSNPSRIPFEFMAAGVVPVDVYRYNNLMDYPSGSIKLAYQSPESIAKAIVELLNDENERLSRKQAGMSFASTRTLEWEMDVFVNNSLLLLENDKSSDSSIQSLYAEKPCISDKDQRNEVLGFCEWQKKLSQL